MLKQTAVFLPIDPPEHRPSTIRSRIRPENAILKAIAYAISSIIGRVINTEKNLQAAACIGRNTVINIIRVVQYKFFISGKHVDSVGTRNAFFNTEAKRCFATHDEDNDYFNMRIYIILIACVYIQQFNFIQ